MYSTNQFSYNSNKRTLTAKASALQLPPAVVPATVSVKSAHTGNMSKHKATHKPQHTCNCSAYPFPHRQGGGKCNPDELCSHEKYPDEYCPKCEQAAEFERYFLGRGAPHEFYD